jgi:7,8-dihydroneopterin aldolase/epimerase/oxygenase
MDSQYTKILLRDVQVATRVGLASWERETPQLLTVTVELYSGVRDYLGHVTPSSIINYCRIYDFIQSWTVRPHTELVETLVGDLLDTCFECLDVGACRISVTKPQVLDWAAAAGVEVFITRGEYEQSSRGQLFRARTIRHYHTQ